MPKFFLIALCAFFTSSFTSRFTSSFTSSLVVAQINGGQGQGGQGQGQGDQGQGGQFPGGIVINPSGVITAPQAQRLNLALEQKRLKSVAAAQLPADMTKPSKLRKVSLAKLEAACQQAVDAGKSPGPDLKYLAGITQLQYLFALPESGDLIIAGPAEGYAPMADGRVVGIETGRPVLTLDDLLVMLRLRSTAMQLGCSFDPNATRLAQAQAWNKANSSATTVDIARRRFFQMAEVLGNWDVRVFGFPPSSHAAVSTVEADFEMKCIALGLKTPQIRGFLSHLQMAVLGENTMRRWWFAPHYNVIERSAAGDAFHIDGPRLQLMAQDELVDADGNRSEAAFTEVSTERYTKQFNKHLPALCQQVPAFASTQNLFDLAIAAALIRQHQLHELVSWQPSLFLDAEKLPLQKYTVPTEVPSLTNVKTVNRGLLMGLVGGGVTIIPDRVVIRTNVLPADRTPEFRPTDNTAWWWD